MIWAIVIAALLVIGIGKHLVTAPKTPLSPNPTEYAKELSCVRQAEQVMNFSMLAEKQYFVRYAYLYVYVRMGRRDALNEENRFVRKLIWNFKEGIYDKELVYRVAKVIERVVDEPLEKKVLICIPASSSMRHEKRFMNFSREVCELTGLQNGFGWLTVQTERVQSHLTTERLLPEWENIIDAPNWKLRRTKVVLLDDLLTTGKSYGSFKAFLESKGAQVCCGVFLATVPENQ